MYLGRGEVFSRAAAENKAAAAVRSSLTSRRPLVFNMTVGFVYSFLSYTRLCKLLLIKLIYRRIDCIAVVKIDLY